MMPPETILLIDPEPRWASLLRQVLSDAGCAVQVASKGERALQIIALEPLALVLLEMRLPGEVDGFTLLERIREFSDLPVILMSADGGTEEILRGFQLGADDYIAKPFDARILLARIRALLNRCRGRVAEPGTITVDNLVIDQASRRVTMDGIEIYLTETEFNLLAELARRRNQVLPHEQLIAAVWNSEPSGELDNLRSYIHILRRKLESNPARPRRILSRPGIGYMLVSNPTEIQEK